MPVDDSRTQAALDALALRLGNAAQAIASDVALLAEAEGMRRTKVKTGTNRRSWRIKGPHKTATGYTAEVGPTMVYSRRLELGFFNMRDSLGRLYHQRPDPYVAPAQKATHDKADTLARARLIAAIKGG